LARILGLDYGKSRTGVAATDILQLSINPLPTQRTENLEEFLENYITNNELESIVIGYPTHADGTPTALTKHIDQLVKKINKKNPDIEIHLIDESFTSVEARNILVKMGVKKKARMKKENIDRSSAVLILKAYLDKKFGI
jgi:putative Holliday junction resolvase